MKRMLLLTLLVVLLFGALQYGAKDVFALDAPHDTSHPTNKVNCSNCHYPYGTTPPWLTQPVTEDNTTLNNLCKSCHIPGYGMSDANYENVQTHSSYKTSTNYGTWVMECVTCHNPHYQRQASAYRTEGYIETGTSTGMTTTTLTDTTKTWAVDAFVNQALIPNSTYPTLMYRIVSNTADTITVQGSMYVPSYANTGDAYGIKYANMVKDIINITATGPRAVKFFNSTGTNSFADGEPNAGGVDTVVDGVCQVCHTQTHSYKTDGTIETAGHPSGNVGTNCTSCHVHTDGFKAACNTCHGDPPVNAATLVFDPPAGTGSTTAGAHNRHVTAENIGCGACHANSVGSGATHNNGDLNISMGFWIFNGTHLGGSYDGQTTANYNSSEVNTTVSNTGTKTCSNLYCHGNYPGSGLNDSPAWDGTAPCGSCHRATNTTVPNSGAHLKHASANSHEYPCTLCHQDIVGGSGPASYTIADRSKHVSGYVDWKFDVADPKVSATSSYSIASGTAVPSDGMNPRIYGTCANLYCHSIAQTASGGPLTGLPGEYATTPIWSYSGGSGFCGFCHKNGSHHNGGNPAAMDSGSHSIHLSYNFNAGASGGSRSYKCAICHRYESSPAATYPSCDTCHGITTVPVYDAHVDGTVDVTIDTYFGNATYDDTSPTPGEPGNGFFSCSNTYCHSNGTSTSVGTIPTNTSAPWGITGPLACSACHGDPPVYTPGSPKSNSHTAHIAYTCDKCHSATTTTGTSITDTANHVDKEYDIAAGTGVTIGGYVPVTPPSTAGGTCNNISCHDGNNATWGGPSYNCGDCHLGALDANDFIYNNGTIAKVSSTEWGYSGHGKATGQYDVTLNAAANFPGAAGTGDPCLYCHDRSGVGHGNTGNPFRLRNFADVTYGKNGVCEACHATGASGVDPDGAGAVYANKNATKKIDKYHYGSQHSATLNGGQFCWDCHDPHGDSTSAASGPVAMVQLNPAAASDSATGVPTSVTATAVAFTNNTNPADYGKTATPFNGVCNVCHTYKATNPNRMVHYTSTSSDGHNSGTICSQCHQHSSSTTFEGEAFRGGGCNGCHDYDTNAGSWGKNQLAIESWGAHAKHIDHIKARFSVTLDPNADSFGTNAAAQICGTCHTNAAGNHTTGGGGTRSINFGDGTYKEGGAAGFSFLFDPAAPGTNPPTYSGVVGTSSSVNPKTCSNVSCHFMTTPYWQLP